MIPEEETELSNYTKEEIITSSTNNNNNNDTTCASRAVAVVSSSSSRLKDDPRIVRVPRAFGGKDRHSKVCTVRGLRDRRVRLSVPTAIQLYDLQDRLGLNQPSKVVDWLLNEAKEAIDELPPLQIPHQGMSSISQQQSFLHHPAGFMMNYNSQHHHHHEFLSPPHTDKSLNKIINWPQGKDKQVSGGADETLSHHQNWGRRNHDHDDQLEEAANERSHGLFHHQQAAGAFASSTSCNDNNNDLSSRQSITFPSLFNGGNLLPCNPSIRWDNPSSVTAVSHDIPAQRSHEESNNNEDFRHHNYFSLLPLQPPHIPGGSHSVPVHRQQQPGGVSTTSRSFNAAGTSQASTSRDFESKQQAADFHHGLQLSNSSLTSSPAGRIMRPFQFHMSTANLLPQDTDVEEQNNSNQFHSS